MGQERAVGIKYRRNKSAQDTKRSARTGRKSKRVMQLRKEMKRRREEATEKSSVMEQNRIYRHVEN